MSSSTTSSYDKNEARGKSYRRRTTPRAPTPEFSDIRLKGKTVKRLSFFSTMDNESFDDIINKMCDVCEGRRRRSIFDGKKWLRESSSEYKTLLPYSREKIYTIIDDEE